jgi:hypothetical protein
VTHEIGHNALRAENINPLQNGLRLLPAALVAHRYPANQFGNVNITTRTTSRATTR